MWTKFLKPLLCQNYYKTALCKNYYQTLSVGNNHTLSCKMSLKGSTERKILVDDIPINFLHSGNGDHIVLCLPGLLGTIWTDFSSQIFGFNLDKYTLIVWDPPGYGHSRPPEKNYTPNFSEFDADMAAKLMSKLKISKYSVLGWSDGGTTGLILAAKHPESVNKLVVWGSNAYVTDEDIAAYERVRNVADWSPSMRFTLTKVYGEELLKRQMNAWVDCIIDILKSRNGNICRDYLRKIQAPTFILHGLKDPLVPRVHCDYLVKNIKHTEFHIFDDGKHNIHIKYSDEFNKLVQEFLEK